MTKWHRLQLPPSFQKTVDHVHCFLKKLYALSKQIDLESIDEADDLAGALAMVVGCFHGLIGLAVGFRESYIRL